MTWLSATATVLMLVTAGTIWVVARLHASTPTASSCSPTIAYTQALGNGRSEIAMQVGCNKLIAPPAGLSYADPTLSTDGTTVAFAVDRGNASDDIPIPASGDSITVGGSTDVYAENLKTAAMQRITNMGDLVRGLTGQVSNLAYAPNGQSIAFSWSPTDTELQQAAAANGIYVTTMTHANTPTEVYSLNFHHALEAVSWSSDSTSLLTSYVAAGSVALFSIDTRTKKFGNVIPLPGTLPAVGQAFYSPDDQWILLIYAPSLSQPTQLWVRSVRTGRMFQVTHAPNGIVAAGMANDWTVYYREPVGLKAVIGDESNYTSTTIHSLSLATGIDKTFATVPGRFYDLSVRRYGQVEARPHVLK